MSILIFFIVLSVLVLVHELGHFIAAKLCKVSVREFGFGFPPKLIKLFRWKETIFTLNALPFGGFVKMEGEDSHVAGSNSFSEKHPAKKLFILVAGIIGNLLFAWALLSTVLMTGTAISAETAQRYNISGQAHTVIVSVEPNSPAANAGITTGTTITAFTPTELQNAVLSSNGNPITIQTTTGDDITVEHTLTPEFNNETQTYKIGITSESIVNTKIPILKAKMIGFRMTAQMTKNVAVGFVHLIGGLFTGNADTSSVTGPIGLANIVGQASKVGIQSVLLLTAVISINLAVLNLLPFPALDGGRIFVTIIEWIRGRQFNQNVLGKIHSIGFLLLIGVLIAVTVQDIGKLF